MKLRRAHPLALSCALLAAGCGAGAGRVSAGALVTKADAERVLGVPARLESEAGDGVRESTCVYVAAGGDDGPSLQVTVQSAESAEQIKEAEELAKRVLAEGGARVETVAGVGDGAWLERREGSRTLHVRKGRVAFLLAATRGVNREPSYEELEQLARRVAGKL